jgi:hypothetical protein
VSKPSRATILRLAAATTAAAAIPSTAYARRDEHPNVKLIRDYYAAAADTYFWRTYPLAPIPDRLAPR